MMALNEVEEMAKHQRREDKITLETDNALWDKEAKKMKKLFDIATLLDKCHMKETHI